MRCAPRQLIVSGSRPPYGAILLCGGPAIENLWVKLCPQERRAAAKAHVAECLARAKRFHQLLNVPAVPPAGTTLHLFAGDAIPTVETLNSNLENRTLTPRTNAPGDRTVTRKSTLADQRSSNNWQPSIQSPIQYHDVRFLFDDHFGLTRDAEFTDNALYLLLEDPTKSSPSRLMREPTFGE